MSNKFLEIFAVSLVCTMAYASPTQDKGDEKRTKKVAYVEASADEEIAEVIIVKRSTQKQGKAAPKTKIAAAKMVVDNGDVSQQQQVAAPPVNTNRGWDGHRPARFNNGWSIEAEFLWWKVYQEASEFVTSSNVAIPTVVDSDTLGNYKSAAFDWSAGVRATVGYMFQRDLWQLVGHYTYFHTDGENSVTKPKGDEFYIFATFTDHSVTGLKHATSHIEFRYDTADLLLMRRFLVSEQILLNFSLGAIGAWIDEDWHIRYLDGTTTRVTNDWDFKGGGAVTGLDSFWHLGQGFALFGKVSVAALLGSYLNKSEILVNPVLPGSSNPQRKTNYKNHFIVPMTQMAFGVDWNKEFKSVVLRIGVGVEAITWVGLQEVYKDSEASTDLLHDKKDIRNTSNVSLFGATAALGLDF